MTRRYFIRAGSMAGLLILIGGCTPSSESDSSPATRQSSNLDCILLLHQLLSEEQHLSKVLLVKKESETLETLVKQISATAAQHVSTLEEMLTQMGTKPDQAVLPPGEVATRKAIANSKQKTLLAASGAEFEFELLLTQIEALNYGAHLALVASDNAPDPERAALFLRIRTDLLKLHGDVRRQLQATHKATKP